MAIHRAAAAAAIAFRHISRRFLSTSSAASPSLLGYFHQPEPTKSLADAFQPLTASSPSLSLGFLPADAAASEFDLFDSRHGLVLLRGNGPFLPDFLVCDTVSRRHALFPSPPIRGREFVGAALLSRAGRRFEFDAVCLTVHGDRPRAWLASYRDGAWCWTALPPSRDVAIDFDPILLEERCVHAADGLYWHIRRDDRALVLDTVTMKFSLVRPPALIWELAHYRFGEMPDDGRLCVAALAEQKLRLCVRRTGSADGWVLERETCLSKVFDSVPELPEYPLSREFIIFLGGVDPGRAGRVFIRTFGYGCFSYHLDTGKLDIWIWVLLVPS
ncbi:hypothetical protein SETIT_2G150100v2 [Setaria italica]|uniref:DUF1618 domain-containing protein n=1 Tax=Setaria italica TaxID=4555 RepID=A0A368PZK7_SETIT|nr:hypothetical protein SETIT_2G150100v2 [Setaria italica]